MPIYLFFFYIERNERYEFVGSCTCNQEEEFRKKVDTLNDLMYSGTQEVIKVHTYLGCLAINFETFQ